MRQTHAVVILASVARWSQPRELTLAVFMNLQSAPSIAKLAACLGFFFWNASALSQDRTYAGKVGRLEAIFTLRWQDGDLVTGSYFCPSGKSISYELRGENKINGRLNLDEFTHGQLTAKIVLQKIDKMGKISWQGTMHNVDGRKLPVSFTRTSSVPAPKTSAVSTSSREYLAIWDRTRVTCMLDWSRDGTVRGTMRDPSTGEAMEIQGSNPQEGLLRLNWQRGGQLESAELNKSLTSKGIVWQGWLSSGKPFILTRLRSGGAPANASETYEQVRITVAPQTVWPTPLFQGKEISSSAFRAELGKRDAEQTERHPLKAVIESVSKSDGTLQLSLRTLEFDNDYDKKHYIPSLEQFTFSVPTLAEPQSFQPGDECFASVDKTGQILGLRLGSASITHWRKRANGFIEVLTGHDRGLDRGPAVPREYLPDRLDLSEHSGGQPFPRDLYFTPSFGLILHIEMAGIGEMELESLPAPKTGVEKLWISEQKQGGRHAIPSIQRAYDAG